MSTAMTNGAIKDRENQVSISTAIIDKTKQQDENHHHHHHHHHHRRRRRRHHHEST